MGHSGFCLGILEKQILYLNFSNFSIFTHADQVQIMENFISFPQPLYWMCCLGGRWLIDQNLTLPQENHQIEFNYLFYCCYF